MNRAGCIICRSGYTSIMEIAELGKRHALFIPTPGQTEQEYLSWYYEKMGWFHSQNQYHLHLGEDILQVLPGLRRSSWQLFFFSMGHMQLRRGSMLQLCQGTIIRLFFSLVYY